jgi:hypothetical protein
LFKDANFPHSLKTALIHPVEQEVIGLVKTAGESHKYLIYSYVEHSAEELHNLRKKAVVVKN